jgi:hypothetical protein
MNKALQAMIDSILRAAGTAELGSANYTPVAPLVRSLLRGGQAAEIERTRVTQFITARQPERLERQRGL